MSRKFKLPWQKKSPKNDPSDPLSLGSDEWDIELTDIKQKNNLSSLDESDRKEQEYQGKSKKRTTLKKQINNLKSDIRKTRNTIKLENKRSLKAIAEEEKDFSGQSEIDDTKLAIADLEKQLKDKDNKISFKEKLQHIKYIIKHPQKYFRKLKNRGKDQAKLNL